MRKIIQICSNSTGPYGSNESLFALCDDGSVWGLSEALDCRWIRVPDVPQDEPKQTEQIIREN
ncbi:hypothetical protein [Avibacterium paragallinarum]|uniref:hypothetical protein n=1 Tax=Avibacterium paragallinarum TaxID=728 RepID=UPI00397E5DCC